MHQHTVKICRHIESLISLSKGISMVFQEDRFYNINEEFRFFKYRTKMEKTRLDLKRKILYLKIIKLLKKKFVDIRDDDLKYTPQVIRSRSYHPQQKSQTL